MGITAVLVWIWEEVGIIFITDSTELEKNKRITLALWLNKT